MTRNNVTNRPFWLHFRESWKFYFNSCKILIYLYLLFLKSIHFCMFIVQNSSKIFTFLQILSFLKNSPWNLKISYILRLSPLCMNEEKWKKSQEIKFYWDLFSNSVKWDNSRNSTQNIRTFHMNQTSIIFAQDILTGFLSHKVLGKKKSSREPGVHHQTNYDW